MTKSKTSTLLVDPDWETHIWNLLAIQFGIPRLPGLRFLRSGRKRIRLINKSTFNLFQKVPYSGTTGLYVGEFSPTAIRLSMDGAQLLGRFATKQIVELTAEQAKTWLQGNSVNYDDERSGYVIVVFKETIIGCGSLSRGILRSFVSKVRRLKQPK